MRRPKTVETHKYTCKTQLHEGKTTKNKMVTDKVTVQTDWIPYKNIPGL
jgi:hypothetical protein